MRINVYIHDIQVVNIEVTELKILSIIVKKHCKVRKGILKNLAGPKRRILGHERISGVFCI